MDGIDYFICAAQSMLESWAHPIDKLKIKVQTDVTGACSSRWHMKGDVVVSPVRLAFLTCERVFFCTGQGYGITV